jgi:hypothetical protein
MSHDIRSNTSEMSKKIPISVRLDPNVKAGADKLAKSQNRTLTNLIETLLQEACQKHAVCSEEGNRKQAAREGEIP